MLDSEEEESDQREGKVSRKKPKAELEEGRARQDSMVGVPSYRNYASFSIGVSEKLSEDKV